MPGSRHDRAHNVASRHRTGLDHVTASLTVDFRRPTPIGVELEITGRLKARDGRKSWIDLALSANGTGCATATMLAIRLRPENRGS